MSSLLFQGNMCIAFALLCCLAVHRRYLSASPCAVQLRAPWLRCINIAIKGLQCSKVNRRKMLSCREADFCCLHLLAGPKRPDMDRQVSGNIVPMSRSMSDRLRLKLCGAEISRAATRQPAELSGAESGPPPLC